MDFPQGSVVAAQFRQACTDFSFKDRRRVQSLIAVLDSTAQDLAQSDAVRSVAYLLYSRAIN